MTSTPIPTTISISPLLRKLSLSPDAITPAEITTAIDHIFTSQLSQVQVSALLTALHFTKLDERPDIIAAAAEGMRGAGLTVEGLEEMFGDIGGETSTMVGYQGGLVSHQASSILLVYSLTWRVSVCR